MKKNKIITTAVLLTTTVMCCRYSRAQGPGPDEVKQQTAIELAYYKKSDTVKTAVAIITATNKEGKFVPAKNAKVNFYTVSGKEQQLLKSTSTNNKGRAEVALPGNLPLDDSLFFTIVAKIENDPLLDDATEQVHYKDARLALIQNPRDSARLVVARVTETGKDGKEVPVKDAEVKFYTQRLFGFLPAVEDNAVSTDEHGEATFNYPPNIPGDTAGQIIIAARLDDNKLFGNVENRSKEYWGSQLAQEKNAFPRALWEPYAPFPLVITVSTLFGGIWIVFFYIFFQLRKIKKEHHLIAGIDQKPLING